MAFCDPSHYRRQLPLRGTHPNHPVVLVSPHEFYETRGGSILPFRRSFGALALACDPLLGQDGPEGALAEFDEAFANRAVAFAGVTEPVATTLAALGYLVLKVGEEPWIDLKAFQPKGNRGKGVRAARNQALKAGCVAGEWPEVVFQARRKEVE